MSSVERTADIIRRYLAFDEPLRAIADDYGISRERVRQIATDAGCPPRGLGRYRYPDSPGHQEWLESKRNVQIALASGLSSEAIRCALGVSANCVARIAREMGISAEAMNRRKLRCQKRVDEQAANFWNAGLPIREIAKTMGTSEATVRNYLQRSRTSPTAVVRAEYRRRRRKAGA